MTEPVCACCEVERPTLRLTSTLPRSGVSCVFSVCESCAGDVMRHSFPGVVHEVVKL